MSKLLDLYRMRMGDAVKIQGGAHNGPCPLCGGEPGKSDRFIIWQDRNKGLGKVCAENSLDGIWACRQCGASGDTVAYLTKIEGMSFKEALAELGINTTYQARRRKAPAEPVKKTGANWTPREVAMPHEKWLAYAERLVQEGESSIWQHPEALKWLAARGIDEKAINKYRIGYLNSEGAKYAGRYRARSAFGLEPKVGQDGKTRTKLFIPRGIVVPSLDADGRVTNIRIRRPKPDLVGKSPKYLELEGSAKAPLVLTPDTPKHLAVYFIVEAELDAMLIHHATDGKVGAVAVRTNRGKPDIRAHGLLTEAMMIGVALDYDDAGSEGVAFWQSTYRVAKRWPTPQGKDPGDAFALGVDIREWVAAALPKSANLDGPMPNNAVISSENCEQKDGRVDPNPSGLSTLGEGEKENLAIQQTPDVSMCFTEAENYRLKRALPPDYTLGTIGEQVARAYLLWVGLKIRFIKYRDENNNSVGFAWDVDYAWCSSRPDLQQRVKAFLDFQYKNRELWMWLSDHVDLEITADNLFWLYGRE